MPAYTTLSLRERAGVRVGISSTSASGFRRDCTLTPKSLSRRERDDPIRQSLLESRDAILFRYCRLTPMGARGEGEISLTLSLSPREGGDFADGPAGMLLHRESRSWPFQTTSEPCRRSTELFDLDVDGDGLAFAEEGGVDLAGGAQLPIGLER